MRPILLALATLFCLAIPARATVWTFHTSLDGSQEVPPTETPATGMAVAMVNDVTGQMIASGSYQNLRDVGGEAHVHCCAPPGEENAFQLVVMPTTGGTSGTFSGQVTADNVHVQLVLNGMSYINVHSAFAPGGEIRGQLVNPTAPANSGDYNGDGHVDAADYVTWRNGKEQIFGEVDYGTWRAHFGESAGGNGSQFAGVPEPSELALMLLCTAVFHSLFTRARALSASRTSGRA